MDTAFAYLKRKGIEEAVLYDRKPLTPPQLENALTKKVYKELLAESGHVITKSGAPTLAPEDDKRPGITNQVNPEDVFGPTPEQPQN